MKLKTTDFLLKILKDAAVSSVLGCTEVLQLSSLFESSLPAYNGEMNAAALGTSLQVFDKDEINVFLVFHAYLDQMFSSGNCGLREMVPTSRNPYPVFRIGL
ncbi:hypothetical protein NPIL_167551 [Nephila pilipes]|uniref:Uncharacterized protein n=1 Tax=Nephila pilipes TaxID=299642 RepID=A0A8X6JY61_NEPPI|nr:hypothetical protein NPIL_167551 [Nephila pilipes]